MLGRSTLRDPGLRFVIDRQKVGFDIVGIRESVDPRRVRFDRDRGLPVEVERRVGSRALAECVG